MSNTKTHSRKGEGEEGEGGKLYAGATSVEKVVFHALTQLWPVRSARTHDRAASDFPSGGSLKA